LSGLASWAGWLFWPGLGWARLAALAGLCRGDWNELGLLGCLGLNGLG